MRDRAADSCSWNKLVLPYESVCAATNSLSKPIGTSLTYSLGFLARRAARRPKPGPPSRRGLTYIEVICGYSQAARSPGVSIRIEFYERRIFSCASGRRTTRLTVPMNSGPIGSQAASCLVRGYGHANWARFWRWRRQLPRSGEFARRLDPLKVGGLAALIGGNHAFRLDACSSDWGYEHVSYDGSSRVGRGRSRGFRKYSLGHRGHSLWTV